MLAINHHKIIKNDNLEKKLAELRAKIRVAKAIGKRDAAAKYELEKAGVLKPEPKPEETTEA